MPASYSIRTIQCPSGERLPFLVDVNTGLPEFDPTLFVLQEVRGQNLATSTIEQVLRSIKVLLLYCYLNNMSLDARLSQGQLLDASEIEDLARFCRKPLEVIEADVRSAAEKSESTPIQISKWRFRTRRARNAKKVGDFSVGIRLRHIVQYLRWLSNRKLLSTPPLQPLYNALNSVVTTVLEMLEARIPNDRGRNTLGKRMGLSEDVQKRIWEVTEPNSPENPWRGEHNRIRNGLIIRWFFALGLRRGELLGVGIRHIDFRKNTVVIVRRADDKNDPRRNQPNAKTLDRELPMSDDLVKRTHEYILKYRRNQRKAKSHQFLFVANGGAPLGLRQVNRIFETLRKRCPELPDEIFPHLLRHTWNDNFSIEMDAQEIKAEHEQKMRSRLMGWSPTSKTAALYTRRHTQRAARKASLGLQEKMVKPKHD